MAKGKKLDLKRSRHGESRSSLVPGVLSRELSQLGFDDSPRMAKPRFAMKAVFFVAVAVVAVVILGFVFRPKEVAYTHDSTEFDRFQYSPSFILQFDIKYMVDNPNILGAKIDDPQISILYQGSTIGKVVKRPIEIKGSSKQIVTLSAAFQYVPQIILSTMAIEYASKGYVEIQADGFIDVTVLGLNAGRIVVDTKTKVTK